MKVILALEVNLAIGTQRQLFQHLIDQNHGGEFLQRTPDGDTYLHYGIKVETVVIGTEILMAEEAEGLPPELEI